MFEKFKIYNIFGEMSGSPYLNDERRQYVKENKIEDIVSDAVNSLLKELPENSFSFLSNFFAKVRLSTL